MQTRSRGTNIYQGSNCVSSGDIFGEIRDPNDISNSFRAKYIFDFYLQLDIACINGNFLAPEDYCPYQIETIDMNIIKPEFEKEIEQQAINNAKTHPPVASVYFKFSHRDFQGQALNYSN